MIPSNPDSRLHLPESVRYALVALLVLLVTPALLQGVMAFVHAFTHTLEITIVALGFLGGGLLLWHSDRQQQQQRKLIQEILDGFLREGQPFQLTDLAEKLGLPAPRVKHYLDKISQTDKTLMEVDNGGITYYYVSKSACSHPSPSPESEETPESELLPKSTTVPATPNFKAINQPFIQAELARRLQVSSSTIGKRKLKPDFTEWTRSKDPDGLSWRYSQVTKQFYPQP